MNAKDLALALLVALCGLAAHAVSLGGEFVYDDFRFVEKNPSIHALAPVEFFTDPATASQEGGIQHDIYRPLRTLLFAAEYALFGVEPVGWHVVSLLLHLLNGMLLFVLLRSYVPSALAAAAGAVLFVVHPVTSESVAWVSSQGDLLAVTLMLGALLVFLRDGIGRTVGGTLLFALACFAKESALVLPALVFLQDLIVRSSGRDGAPSWRTTWTRAALGLVVIVVYFVLRQSVLPVLAQVPHVRGSAWGSLQAALAGLVWSAGALVLPRGFTFDAQIDIPFGFGEPAVVFGLGLLLSTILLGLYAIRTRRFVLAFAALGFLACLVPVSNVFVPLKAFVAERFLYPGLICVAAGVAAVLAALPARSRTVALGLFAVVLFVFTAQSARRDGVWHDEVSLWTAVKADRPTNPNAYQGLAFAYHREGRVKEAERAIDTYLSFNPIDGKAWMLRGDNFKAAAESLYLDPEPGVVSDVKERRNLARRSQIAAYREAWRLWNAFGERSRLSEAMVRGMLVDWKAAGEDLGDLGAQKRANDRLIELDGIDPSEREAVERGAGWSRRLARLAIALQAVDRDLTGRRESPAVRAQAMTDRAEVLRDVGLEPAQRNELLRPAVARAFVAMYREAAAQGVPVSPAWHVNAARSLAGIGQREAAMDILRIGLQRYPDDVNLATIMQQAGR